MILFVVAFLLRAIGAWWGAPYGDERPGYAAKVLVGQLVPSDHYYPPLLYYVDAVAFGVLFVLGRLLVVWHTTAEFRDAFFQYPELFTVTCRIVVAALAGAAAPLAALAARKLGAPWRLAFIVGLVIALQPVNVWWGHVSKPQMPMTTGVFAMAVALLHALDHPTRRAPWLLLGGAIAVAVAFKHTAAFFALTMTVSLIIAQLTRDRIPLKELIIRGVGLGVVAAVIWAPLSIGVLLDFENFLAYQKIQALMSKREAPILESLGVLLPILVSTLEGATWPGLLLAVAAPFVERTAKHVTLFASNLAALAIVESIAATRVTPGLLLPFTGLFLLQGASFAACRAADERARSAWLGRIGLGACLLATAWGSAEVLRQALLAPTSKRVAEVVQALGAPGEIKVLASRRTGVGLTISHSAMREERLRHERLAAKYGVDLPPQAEERAKPRGDQSLAYHIVEFPWVIHGLEVYDEEELKGKVRSMAWPLQKEEWKLDYWRSRGFEVFVVDDSGLIDTVPIYRAFFEELFGEAERIARIESPRPLFFEPSVSVYRIAPEPENGAQTSTVSTPVAN